MKITWTGNATLRAIVLKDSANAIIAGNTGGGFTSPTILPISFGANDIAHLELDTGSGQSSFAVTGIEFA